MDKDLTRVVHISLNLLTQWISHNGLRGYDPYDGLSNPILAALGRLSNLAGRVAVQSLLYLPFNIRPLLGIKKEYDAKALGLIARGYFLIWDQTHRPQDWERGIECLGILEEICIPGFSGACWGHPFPYRSRRGYLPAHRPSIVSTFYSAQAFLDAYQRSGEKRYLQTARSACDFILEDLEHIGDGETFCFSYLPSSSMAVHNTNLLAVQLLARVSRLAQEPALIDAAKPALQYTLDDQNLDGSWLYDAPHSVSRENTFIDGYHTGFILESLWDIMNDTKLYLQEPLRRGLSFYLEHLFSPAGQPYRYLGRPWPVDLRDSAQAIIVLSKFPAHLVGEDLLPCVLEWTIRKMQAPGGYFYFRRGRLGKNLIPYIRFQAWMLASLATAAKVFSISRAL